MARNGSGGFLTQALESEDQQDRESGSGGFLSRALDEESRPRKRTEKDARAERQKVDVDEILAQEGASHLRDIVNAIHGKESSHGKNAKTSVDGARGPMQVVPDTFKRFAKPGEDIDNPRDNMAVGVRYIKHLAKIAGGDPAKIAVGYISGEGNIGKDTPYKADPADGLGTRTSAYAADIVRRLGGKPVPVLPDGEPPSWKSIAQDKRYQELDSEGRSKAREEYFRSWIEPAIRPAERDDYRNWFEQEAAGMEPPERPGVFARMGDAIGRAMSNENVPGPGFVDPMTGIDVSGANGIEESVPTPGGFDPALVEDQFKSGVTGMQKSFFANNAKNAAAMIHSMDRIDAGERLPMEQDPLGYGQMDPEQRAQVRAEITQSLPGNIGKVVQYHNEQGKYRRNKTADATIDLANKGDYAGAWAAFASDPVGVIQQLSVESLPNSLPGLAAGGVGGILMKGGIGALMGGMAAGSFPVEYIASITDSLNDAGVDMSDAAAVDAKLRDPKFVEAAGKRAVTRGLTIAAAEAATGKMLMPLKAGQLGRNIGRGAANIGIETGMEGLGEAGAQTLSGEEIKLGDVAAEMLGAGPQAAGGTIIKTLTESAGGKKPEQPPRERVEPTMHADWELVDDGSEPPADGGTPETHPALPAPDAAAQQEPATEPAKSGRLSDDEVLAYGTARRQELEDKVGGLDGYDINSDTPPEPKDLSEEEQAELEFLTEFGDDPEVVRHYYGLDAKEEEAKPEPKAEAKPKEPDTVAEGKKEADAAIEELGQVLGKKPEGAKEAWQMTRKEHRNAPDRGKNGGFAIEKINLDNETTESLIKRPLGDVLALGRMLGAKGGMNKKKTATDIMRVWGLRGELATATKEQLLEQGKDDLATLAKRAGVYGSHLNKDGLANAIIGWRDDQRKKTTDRHQDAKHYYRVAQALERGEQVPAEVLKDYPDLALDHFDRGTPEYNAAISKLADGLVQAPYNDVPVVIDAHRKAGGQVNNDIADAAQKKLDAVYAAMGKNEKPAEDPMRQSVLDAIADGKNGFDGITRHVFGIEGEQRATDEEEDKITDAIDALKAAGKIHLRKGYGWFKGAEEKEKAPETTPAEDTGDQPEAVAFEYDNKRYGKEKLKVSLTTAQNNGLWSAGFKWEAQGSGGVLLVDHSDIKLRSEEAAVEMAIKRLQKELPEHYWSRVLNAQKEWLAERKESGGKRNVAPEKIRDRLMQIAKRLGVHVVVSKTGFNASMGMVNIPEEDGDIEKTHLASADHIFAHELGHFIMHKRGMSFHTFPNREAVRKWIANFDEWVEASKAFRPGVWNAGNERIRRHARKFNEIIADAIGSVLMGDNPPSLVLTLGGLTEYDLGLKDVEAPASKAGEANLPDGDNTGEDDSPRTEVVDAEETANTAEPVEVDSESVDAILERLAAGEKIVVNGNTYWVDDGDAGWQLNHQIGDSKITRTLRGGFGPATKESALDIARDRVEKQKAIIAKRQEAIAAFPFKVGDVLVRKKGIPSRGGDILKLKIIGEPNGVTAQIEYNDKDKVTPGKNKVWRPGYQMRALVEDYELAPEGGVGELTPEEKKKQRKQEKAAQKATQEAEAKARYDAFFATPGALMKKTSSVNDPVIDFDLDSPNGKVHVDVRAKGWLFGWDEVTMRFTGDGIEGQPWRDDGAYQTEVRLTAPTEDVIKKAAAKALQEHLDEVAETKETKPAKKPKTETEAKEAKMMAEGKQEVEDALRELGDLLGKGSRAAIMPEQHDKVVTILTKLMGGLLKQGYVKFKQAAREAMRMIRDKLGDEIANDITLDHLQGAYIGMAGLHKDKGTDPIMEVAKYETLEDVLADETVSVDLIPPALAADNSRKAKLVKLFARHFNDEGAFGSITEARQLASLELRTAIETGTVDAKMVDEAIEAAAVIVARKIVAENSDPQVVFDKLLDLYNRMPNLNVRTSTSTIEQAYSTPLPLAWVGSQLAGITDETTVYEATAGNGALLIGVTPEAAEVNELNSDRLQALQWQGFEPRNADATTNAAMPQVNVDVVYINPPFGKIGGKEWTVPSKAAGGSYKTTEIDHAIALKSLQVMQDNGRAVLIVGSVFDGSANKADAYLKSKPMKEFYLTLYKEYRVVDHFTVDGKLYSKQGASWPVDVIVIDGRGKATIEVPWMTAPPVFKTWDGLKGKLNGNNSVEAAGQGTGNAVRNGGSGAGGNADAGGPSPAGGGSPASTDSGVALDTPGAAQDDQGQRQRNGVASGRIQQGSRTDGNDAVSGHTPGDGRGADLGADKNANDGGAGAAVPVGGNNAGTVAQSGGNANRVTRKKEETTATQADYEPRSKLPNVGTLVPVNMRDAVAESLDRLEERVGPVDDYVMRELQYPDKAALAKAFSAEQVDALALAIDNISRDGGFIIGDQTGIGKGRVNAGIIRYAILNGMTPVFVTAKANLYGDMYRDLTAIGQDDIGILMTDAEKEIPLNDDGAVLKTPAAKKHNAELERMANAGRLDKEYDVIFSTYDSLNTYRGGMTSRMRLVETFARNGILILDESHSAGGQPVEKTKAVDILNRASFFRRLVSQAKGVFYSSATYAKRPDVMDLYAKTEMRFAVSNPRDLGAAIAAGGVPLQQVVAAMLARSGQYIRRERTFAGIKYETQTVAVDRVVAENTATTMRLILDFDRVKQRAVRNLNDAERAEGTRVSGDGSTGGAGAESTKFSSIMHNLISQMLLALKADATANNAIAQIKAGQRPVITVANTMESLTDEFVRANGVRNGDPIVMTFGDLLKRYLDKSRNVSVRKPFQTGKVEPRRLTDEELGPEGVAMYKNIIKFIDEQDWSAMSASPIDYIKNKIEKAGYKISEITGRGTYIDYSGVQPLFRVRKAAERSTAGRRKTISDFNNGRIDAILLNQAGSTGLSLHASPSEGSDVRQRTMDLGQLELNVDTHMQMLGRINRTGQVVAPEYVQLAADVPAEKRPAAVIAKKMGSLSATTTANKNSALSADTIDFLNDIGDEAVATLMWNDPDLHERLGDPLDFDGNVGGYEREEAARKVTGRIPILPLAEQEALYAQIEEEYVDLLKNREALGESGLEAQTLDLRAEVKAELVMDEGTPSLNSEFAGPIKGLSVEANKIGKPLKSEEVMTLLRREAFGDEGGNASLSAIRDAADKKLQGLVAQTRKDFNAYLANATADMGDAAGRTVVARLNSTITHLESMASEFPAGTRVSLRTPMGRVYYGVIGKFYKSGKSANPAAGSTWKVTIYLASSARQVTLSLYALTSDEKTAKENLRYLLAPATQDIFDREIIELFDQSQTMAREERVIITGNLLAAFAHFQSGRIVNFTMQDGTLQQGILMPEYFDLQSATRSLIPTLQNPEAAQSFIERDSEGWLVGAYRSSLEIRHNGSGYRMSVPIKKEYAQFYQNDQIRDAIRHREFVKANGGMRGEVTNLPLLLAALYEMKQPLKGMTPDKEVKGNTRLDDRGGYGAGEHLDEAKRLQVQKRLEKLIKRRENGEFTESELMLGLQNLVADLSERNQAKRLDYKPLVRGELWIREKLINAKRTSKLDERTVDMALWMLDQNPNLAEGLAISIKSPKNGEDSLGYYESLYRTMTLFTTAGDATAVHEILHHTERMMPVDVQDGIRMEWFRAWKAAHDAAVKAGNVKLAEALLDIQRANMGDRAARRRVNEAFGKNGVLKRGEHYQLVNPSEYWAVNASTIMEDRYDARKSWIKRAWQWLKEFIEKAKGLLGLRSDAPILRALKEVLNTDGEFVTGELLTEFGDMLADRADNDPHEDTHPTSLYQRLAERFSSNVFRFYGKGGDTFKLRHNFSTQYHKGKLHPAFGTVQKAANKMLTHVSLAATRASELAPLLLPPVDRIGVAVSTLYSSVRSKLPGGKPQQGFEKVSKALYLGTLKASAVERLGPDWTVEQLEEEPAGSVYEGRVWSHDELVSKFGMNETEIEMYTQAIHATQQSLSELAAAEAWSLVSAFLDNKVRDSVIRHIDGAQDQIEFALQQAMAGFDERIANIEESLDNLNDTRRLMEAAWKDIDEQVAEWRAGNRGRPLPSALRESWEGAKARMDAAIAAVGNAEVRLAAERNRRAPLADRLQKVGQIYEVLNRLTAAGYVPIMRFGPYTVEVVQLGANGRPLIVDGQKVRPYFARFDSPTQARTAILELRKGKYGDAKKYRISDVGKMARADNDPVRGVNPETLALFAEVIGKAEAMEEYRVHALSDSSAFKHRLHREGIEGYSEDLPRVLASFITSNARAAAHRFYLRDIDRAIAYNKRHFSRDGDLLDESYDLRAAVLDPKENAAGARSLLFVQFLSGSLAGGLINATQNITFTIPLLAAHVGPQRAERIMGDAMMRAMFGSIDTNGALGRALHKFDPIGNRVDKLRVDPGSDLGQAMRFAAQEGTIDAQEIFHLYAVALSGLTSRIGGYSFRHNSQAIMTLLGAYMSITEKWNRRSAFIAGYNAAVEAGIADPEGFASDIVNQTQIIYNKSNMPNVSRSAPGAVLMVFKMVSIAYVELLFRLWGMKNGKRALMVALGIMLLMAGTEGGIPFMKAINDFIDTIGQFFGFNTNTKRFKRETMEAALQWVSEMAADEETAKKIAKHGTEFAMYGISAFLPVDVSQRIGAFNILPATDALKKSNEDRGRSMLELLGAAGGVGKQLMDGWEALLLGNPGDAFKAILPKFMRDPLAGYDMARSGEARDTAGRTITEADWWDAFFQSIGFNPAVKAEGSRRRSEFFQDEAMATAMQEEVASQFAKGVKDNDQEAIAAAIGKMNRWNSNNPEMAITLGDQKKRLGGGLSDAETRMIQSVPKRHRGEAIERLKD